MIKLNSMANKMDKLITRFKEIQEDLHKNVNASYSSQPNATTGTSGGQGGMYRSEDMNKDGQDIMEMSEVIKFDNNGQWKLNKAATTPDEPKNFSTQGKDKMTKAESLANDIIEKLEKSAFKTLQHKIEGQGHSKDSAAAITASIGRKEIGQKEMTARSKAGMHKDESYANEGINRTSSPKEEKMKEPKVHMVKDEGVNSEPKRHHDNFKVMPMTSEKDSKKEKVSGKPYDGSDSKVHKGDSKDPGCGCKHPPCKCGNNENSGPGRHTAFGI